jgi:nitrogen fixation NifU-like protein
MSDDAFYREHILDHFHNPRHFGHLEAANINHEEDNPLCGDKVRIELRVEEGKVMEVAWSGRGCAISMAAASLLSERLEGKSLDEVKQIGKAEVLDDLGIAVSPARLKCALLALSTVQMGVWGQSGLEDETGGG